MSKTCSLELSKKLYEAELKLETEKWWVALLEHETSEVIRYSLENWGRYPGCLSNEMWTDAESNIPAPSTDELLAVMPKTIPEDYEFAIFFHNNMWEIQYTSWRRVVMKRNLQSGVGLLYDKSLPEVLGKMCLWLLQNGYHYSPDKKELLKNE